MALSPPLTMPYIFVNGTLIDAGQVNADFAALTNLVNDNTRNTLAGPTTFYVAPGGSDTAGAGLSPVAPAASITHILQLLRSGYNLNAQPVTIQLANGTYNEAVNNVGAMFGLQGAGGLIVQGNMSSPASVTWNNPGGNACLECSNGALIQVQGVTMTGGATNCLLSHTHSRLLFSNLVFGTTTNAHMVSARGATLHALGNYSITGGAKHHALALEHGEIYLDPEPGDFVTFVAGFPTVTLVGTPAFAANFVTCNNLGLVKVGAIFVGTGATGGKYSANLNGTIGVFGQGIDYLPGNVAGTVTNGGQYG